MDSVQPLPLPMNLGMCKYLLSPPGCAFISCRMPKSPSSVESFSTFMSLKYIFSIIFIPEMLTLALLWSMLGQTGCTDQQTKQRTRTWEFFYFIYCIGLHDSTSGLYLLLYYTWPGTVLYHLMGGPTGDPGQLPKILIFIIPVPAENVARVNLLIIKILKKRFLPDL